MKCKVLKKEAILLKILMTTDNLSSAFLSPMVAKRALEHVYNEKLKCSALFRYIIDEIAIIKMPTREGWNENEQQEIYRGGLYLVSYHVKMRISKNHCQTKRKITPPMIEKTIRILQTKLSEEERKATFICSAEERYDNTFYWCYNHYNMKLINPVGDEVPQDVYMGSITLPLASQVTKNGFFRKISVKGVIEHGVFNLRNAEIVSELERE